MAKNNESDIRLTQRLALISGGLVDIFPKGKSVVVFSLNDDDFIEVKKNAGIMSDDNQFKIVISEIEFIFFRDSMIESGN